jgi:WD40 repeat protein
VLSVALGNAADGRLIAATGSDDRTVRVWDPLTGTPIGAPLTGHTHPVLSVALGNAPDGRLIAATGSDDRTVRIWDPLTGTPIGAPLTGHTSTVLSVALGNAPDGRLIAATGSDDRTVRIWDFHQVARFKRYRLWDRRVDACIGAPLTGHTCGVTAVALGTAYDMT